MRARVLAAAAAALITLVTVEVALRLSALIPLSLPSAPYISDDDIGFKLRPSEITDADGFNNPTSANDPAPARHPAPGTVAFVGDSFVFGTYAPEDVFPALVAADLISEGLTIRAVSLGIPGIGPDAYVRVMHNYLPRLRPEAVVVTIYLGNDIEQSDPRHPSKLWLGYSGSYPDPFSLNLDDLMIFSFAGKLIRLAQSTWYGQYATDTQPSRPEEEGRRSMRASKSALDRVRWLEMKAMRVPPDERIARGYDGLAGYVEQMAILARQNNAKFLVVLAPSQIEIDPDLRGQIIAAFDGDPRNFDGAPPAQRVGESLAARGLPFVDLTAALVAAGPARVYNRDDPHWNRRGNFVAAETIAMALRPLLASP